MSDQLVIKDVTVKFDNVTAIKNICFSLKKGEIGCLLGPSGCGKTTLLRAISGFEPIQAGLISLDNEEISTTSFLKPPEKRKVGMVFQDFALFPHLNVEANVEFGLANLSPKTKIKKIKEKKRKIGLKRMIKS